jgi:hypothetical protein
MDNSVEVLLLSRILCSDDQRPLSVFAFRRRFYLHSDGLIQSGQPTEEQFEGHAVDPFAGIQPTDLRLIRFEDLGRFDLGPSLLLDESSDLLGQFALGK